MGVIRKLQTIFHFFDIFCFNGHAYLNYLYKHTKIQFSQTNSYNKFGTFYKKYRKYNKKYNGENKMCIIFFAPVAIVRYTLLGLLKKMRTTEIILKQLINYG